MRFVSQTAVAALLTANVLGHPHASTSSGSIQKRTVDLAAYKLGVGASYTTNVVIEEKQPEFRAFSKPTYVDTATTLVRSKFPNAEFRLVTSYQSGNGIGHVAFKQTVHGIDIDTADVNVNVGKDGSVFSYGSSFFTGTLPAESPLVKRDQVDPVLALRGASSSLQLGVTAEGAQAVPEKETEKYTITGSSGALSDPKANLVYIQTGNTLSLSWRVETDIDDNWLLSYVDAVSPEKVLAVVDYVSDASYTVYPWKVNDPSRGDRKIETNPWDTKTSEFGWHGTGFTTFNTTRGNNGNAQANFEGDSAFINDFRPYDADLNFNYDLDLNAKDPKSYADASVAQLFYTSNMYHDLLYVLGFNEASGNFESNNNGQGGLGGDPVTLNAQDGSGVNNANFATPIDGQVPRMRMYIWNYTQPVRDCSFDAGVVIHEYTHGLSNRLTGGALNGGCLGTTEGGGMGEGWSDFMAIAIHMKTSDTRNTNYPMGDWVRGRPSGIRTYLYSTSKQTNPMIYSTANNSTLVHFIGTIWATMLYEVMWNLIDDHGITDDRQPKFINGVPTDGRFLAMQLVVDGLKLQPCRPDFITARDGIIDADRVLTGGANRCSIWKAFAKRGLGADAKRSANPNDHLSRVDSYNLPDGVCGCAADNCLRALRASTPAERLGESQAFCKDFTKTVITDVSVVKPYLTSNCAGNVVSRVSSACGCIPSDN
ncbi:related to Extracellular metalloproteinase MEP [Rhynchosporium agropyri]|uniref:Extracellular metalloproteinase n=1 Tax=Rhynchosporium agropyri TaxID=914238 RepID=A0A1E1LLP8_9HELO|nr:related to Extracellular metalloproteinase MEP [Rhynchosporium agropyri]